MINHKAPLICAFIWILRVTEGQPDSFKIILTILSLVYMLALITITQDKTLYIYYLN